MSIYDYFKNNGIAVEGNVEQVPQQMDNILSIIKMINKSNINIMEIGFNSGHSASYFLSNNSNITVTSFDIGDHNYVLDAKRYIDMLYPLRHTLIIGDSRLSVLKFIKDYPDIKFDIIFVDGGHTYEIAKADMENCFNLAHKDTIVILDDTIFTDNWTEPWNIGPTKVWNEFLSTNKITELGRANYWSGRGMAWGRYIFN